MCRLDLQLFWESGLTTSSQGTQAHTRLEIEPMKMLENRFIMPQVSRKFGDYVPDKSRGDWQRVW